jgi:hypothetical protein
MITAIYIESFDRPAQLIRQEIYRGYLSLLIHLSSGKVNLKHLAGEDLCPRVLTRSLANDFLTRLHFRRNTASSFDGQEAAQRLDLQLRCFRWK